MLRSNSSAVTCRMATPDCPEGQVPIVDDAGNCWEGGCMPEEECGSFRALIVEICSLPATSRTLGIDFPALPIDFGGLLLQKPKAPADTRDSVCPKPKAVSAKGGFYFALPRTLGSDFRTLSIEIGKLIGKTQRLPLTLGTLFVQNRRLYGPSRQDH